MSNPVTDDVIIEYTTTKTTMDAVDELIQESLAETKPNQPVSDACEKNKSRIDSDSGQDPEE